MTENADCDKFNEDHDEASQPWDDDVVFATPLKDLEKSVEKNSSVKKSPRNAVVKKLFQPFSPIASSGFQRQVLVALRELNQKVEVISANQTKLNLYFLPNEKVLSKPIGIAPLPVKTQKDMKALLTSLQNSHNINNLAIYLSTFVSKDLDFERKSATKVMEELMGNSVANFKGHGKLSFEGCVLWTVVKGAVTLKLETYCKETANAVKLWLKDAPWTTQEDGSRPRERKKFTAAGDKL